MAQRPGAKSAEEHYASAGTAPQTLLAVVDEDTSPTVPKNSIPQSMQNSQEYPTANYFGPTVMPKNGYSWRREEYGGTEHAVWRREAVLCCSVPGQMLHSQRAQIHFLLLPHLSLPSILPGLKQHRHKCFSLHLPVKTLHKTFFIFYELCGSAFVFLGYKAFELIHFLFIRKFFCLSRIFVYLYSILRQQTEKEKRQNAPKSGPLVLLCKNCSNRQPGVWCFG